MVLGRLPFERYVFHSYEILLRIIAADRINPQQHPMVIDLASGHGGIPWLLVQLGWQEKNITCIDLNLPPEEDNLVPNAQWVKADLFDLFEKWKEKSQEFVGYDILSISYFSASHPFKSSSTLFESPDKRTRFFRSFVSREVHILDSLF